MNSLAQTPKKLITVFALAFVLNWVWEIVHSAFYTHYRGGAITAFILLRAALVDAGIILALVLIAREFKLNRSSVVVAGGLVAALIIELWALQTGRWAYNPLMPVLPIVGVGLTPLIQLAVTGYIAQKIVL